MSLGYTFTFSENKMEVFMHGDFVFCGHLSCGFFRLEVDLDGDQFSSYVSASFSAEDDSLRWHARLGHVDQERMSRLTKEGLLGPLSKISLPMYEPCLVGKAYRKPF